MKDKYSKLWKVVAQCVRNSCIYQPGCDAAIHIWKLELLAGERLEKKDHGLHRKPGGKSRVVRGWIPQCGLFDSAARPMGGLQLAFAPTLCWLS